MGIPWVPVDGLASKPWKTKETHGVPMLVTVWKSTWGTMEFYGGPVVIHRISMGIYVGVHGISMDCHEHLWPFAMVCGRFPVFASLWQFAGRLRMFSPTCSSLPTVCGNLTAVYVRGGRLSAVCGRLRSFAGSLWSFACRLWSFVDRLCPFAIICGRLPAVYGRLPAVCDRLWPFVAVCRRFVTVCRRLRSFATVCHTFTGRTDQSNRGPMYKPCRVRNQSGPADPDFSRPI
eukprot:gene16748-biopygen17280